jgi:hypothetical protein
VYCYVGAFENRNETRRNAEWNSDKKASSKVADVADIVVGSFDPRAPPHPPLAVRKSHLYPSFFTADPMISQHRVDSSYDPTELCCRSKRVLRHPFLLAPNAVADNALRE